MEWLCTQPQAGLCAVRLSYHEVLVRQKGTADFPLFEAIYKIAFEGVPCEKIVEYDSL